MSQLTVSQYAEQMRTTVAIMLSRLEKAGVHKTDSSEYVSEGEQEQYFNAMTGGAPAPRATLGVKPALRVAPGKPGEIGRAHV